MGESMDIPQFNALMAEGERMVHANLIPKAIDVYSKALEAVTLNGVVELDYAKPCFACRSACYLRLGDVEHALKDANTILESDKAYIKAIEAKAEALYFKGDFEYALVFFHRGSKLRPDVDVFRRGIQKAQEAIENAVGDPSIYKLYVTPDITKTLHEGDKERKVVDRATQQRNAPRLSQIAPRKNNNADREKRSIKQLLGELYSDKEYLEDLLNDPSFIVKNDGIKRLVSGGVEFLDKRAEFWRQQKPIYARNNEHQVRNTKRGTTSFIKPPSNKSPAGKMGENDKAISQEELYSQLEDIEQAIDEFRAEAAITKANYLLERVNKMSPSSLPEKQKILASLYGSLGTAHAELGHDSEALTNHQHDYDIGVKEGLVDAQSRALSNLGSVYTKLGDYDAAIEMWLKKVPLTDVPVEIAWLYHELGRCYAALENHVSAMEYGQKALTHAVADHDDRWHMNAAILIAQSAEKLGDVSQALISYKDAIKCAEILDDHEALTALTKAREGVERGIQDGAPASSIQEVPVEG